MVKRVTGIIFLLMLCIIHFTSEGIYFGIWQYSETEFVKVSDVVLCPQKKSFISLLTQADTREVSLVQNVDNLDFHIHLKSSAN